ncbi:S24 family peptidase [Duganella sp. Leaf126]|uniref:S24 family peptidase n=1 Tax=Duganella sp. Leaf126 TaxID=1736266 RepID=UPI001E2E0979|nr:S24 family peptidase [Duganella sp. Leaf126]
MYLSQILNGAKSSTGTPRGVGDALARKLEAGCGKEEGWMDREHASAPDDPMTSERAHALFPGAVPVRIVDADDPDFYMIPKVKLRLSAGITGFQTIPEIHDGSTLMVAKNWVDRNRYVPGQLLAISVKGESMEPNLYEGDQVIVNTGDTKIEDGGVYAVNYEGEAVIKRMTRDRGEWWLTSDNRDQQKYRPKGCRDGECIIIGRVVKRETNHI